VAPVATFAATGRASQGQQGGRARGKVSNIPLSAAEGDHPPQTLPPHDDLAVATPTTLRRTRIILPGQLVERRAKRFRQRPQRAERRLGDGTPLDAADDSGRDPRGLTERLLREAAGYAQGAEAPADGGSGRCSPGHRCTRMY